MVRGPEWLADPWLTEIESGVNLVRPDQLLGDWGAPWADYASAGIGDESGRFDVIV